MAPSRPVPPVSSKQKNKKQTKPKNNAHLPGGEGDTGVPHELTSREQMSQWSVEDVMDFMKASDLEGPGGVLVANGVRGQDLLVVEEDDLRNDLKLSRFATQRVLTARDTFLQH